MCLGTRRFLNIPRADCFRNFYHMNVPRYYLNTYALQSFDFTSRLWRCEREIISRVKTRVPAHREGTPKFHIPRFTTSPSVPIFWRAVIISNYERKGKPPFRILEFGEIPIFGIPENLPSPKLKASSSFRIRKLGN